MTGPRVRLPMVRQSQRLHAPRNLPAPRPAATMLLVRDTAEGLQVLMTRRANQATFAAGAYVFPGGAIDAADSEAHGLASCRPGQSGFALTQALAAIRESFEEMGILLARHADGRMASQADIEALGREVQPGSSFYGQCAARGLTLAAGELRQFARWIADPNNPKRFDTAFFVVPMPDGQVPVADDREQFEPVWVRPAEAIARHKAGSFFMIFPTIRTLELLAAHASVDAVQRACAAEGPLWHNETRSATRNGELVRLTASDPGYGDVALICPEAQEVPALDWRHDAPVALLRNVSRHTTADGSNRYVVGDEASDTCSIEAGAPVGAAPASISGNAIVLRGRHAAHTLRPLRLPDGRHAGWMLEEDGILFTAPGIDTELGVDALCEAFGAEFVLPARGYAQLSVRRTAQQHHLNESDLTARKSKRTDEQRVPHVRNGQR